MTNINELIIANIFISLGGEVGLDGPLQWMTFIRLGGCNLRCYKEEGYCDTPFALMKDHPEYSTYSIDAFMDRIAGDYPNRFLFTGGEPLLQQVAVAHTAMRLTAKFGSDVSVETNGSIRIIPETFTWMDCIIMDLKAPSTGMSGKMYLPNLLLLRKTDYVKCVISDLDDIKWLRNVLDEYPTEANIAIGPRMKDGKPVRPLNWFVELMRIIKLWDWRLNFQFHKLFWPVSIDQIALRIYGDTPEEKWNGIEIGQFLKREV